MSPYVFVFSTLLNLLKRDPEVLRLALDVLGCTGESRAESF